MYDLEEWKRQKKVLRLTFDDLAKSTNLSISTLKAIFSGTTTDPRIETVRAIEKALNLDEELTDEERTAGFTDKRKVTITPIEDEMLYAFREVGKKQGEKGQRALIDVAENMAGIK